MDTNLRRFFNQLELIQILVLVPSVIPIVYLIGLLLDLTGEQFRIVIGPVVVPLVVALLTIPAFLRRYWMQRALSAADKDRRLELLLKLPRVFDWLLSAAVLAGACIFTLVCCELFDKPGWLLLPSLAMTGVASFLMQIPSFVLVERLLLPWVLVEFQAGARVRVHQNSTLWMRQRWFMPFSYGAAIACTVVAFSIIIVVKGSRAFNELIQQAAHGPLSETAIRGAQISLIDSLTPPLVLMFLYLIAITGFAAWLLAGRQQTSATMLEKALQRFAQGEVALPEWVASDETGDLAFGLASVHDQLRDFSRGLRQSVSQLASSAEQLRAASGRQLGTLSRQAQSLQEAHVTAQEIEQTSQLAHQKAQEVLNLADEAEKVGKSGGTAVDEGLRGLADIQSQVQMIVTRVSGLEGKTRQIVAIASTVRDLSNQSNLLALNAAIEAARAGENGKGFAVVAREIRVLADQSIQETRRIQSVLEEITEAIQGLVKASAEGQGRIEASLKQVRTTGDTLQTLSRIVGTNNAAARQIAAAVSQQAAGISQVFEAVSELSRMMNETLSEVQESEKTIGQLQTVAADVDSRSLKIAAAA